MLDQEHAVARPVLLDDDVALLVDLMLQMRQDGGDEAFVTVPEYRHLAEQPGTHDVQNFLHKGGGEKEAM